MENLNAHVVPLLGGGDIRYQANGAVKSMSTTYFRNHFRGVASQELPDIVQSSYYYQSTESPDLVMHFLVSDTAGLSATLVCYSELENRWRETGF
ncbi:hypothetical protein [Pontibacter pamirensis]|uniref:hypothetical protein n=1 Tax=Pontibacter pamirensis TaxID=2562824 RepID=UPI00138993AE|nr:hypothetical protein [Pontibacter pamirensis]